ncbi:MAG: hypothetical protein ISQ06_02180 [Planctomycetaceae bacterium]|nr:hypothetical protein [Planctomycetaceae bacterium]
MSDVRSSHRLLLVVALAAAAAGALTTGYAGLRFGELLLLGHALQLALAGVTCWAALDATSIRHKLADAFAALTGEPDEQQRKAAGKLRRQGAEARSMHPVFLAVPAGCIAGFMAFQLWNVSLTPSAGLSAGTAPTVGLIMVAVSVVWLILAKTFAATDADVREATALSLAFREAQYSACLVAASLLGASVIPALGFWGGRLLSVWVIAVCIEQVARAAALWFLTGPGEPAAEVPNDDTRSDSAGHAANLDSQQPNEFVSPVRLLLRDAFLVSRNPLASVFDTIEARFGLSFRSSWAIQFVRTATVPMFLFVIWAAWLSTGLNVVDLHQLGIEERLGRPVTEPLKPGLHVTLPWPFGSVQRFPVQTVQVMQIGFRENDGAKAASDRPDSETATATGSQPASNAIPDAPRALLWTKSHEEEFGLVLGNGTDIVAVNALIYYQISGTPEGLFDFAYRAQAPADALEVFAYRSLLELTQSARLTDILTDDRNGFAEQFEARLREFVAEQRLGLEVVDVALINMHPPVEVASDYLDVISARLDATRVVVEAEGQRTVAQLGAEAESSGMVASSRIAAARRVATAAQETAEFVAAELAGRTEPLTWKYRVWTETLESILADRPFHLIDQSLFDQSGEVLLDLRGSTLRGSDGPQKLPAVEGTFRSNRAATPQIQGSNSSARE